MEFLPRSKNERRLVILVLVSLAVILVMARLYLSPDDPKVFKDLADSFIATIIVTVGIAVLLRHIDLNTKFELESRILYPSEIGNELAEAAEHANFWEYRGGCGRYERFEVLPTLAKTATRSGRNREIKIELLDPNDIALCEKYATYRHNRLSGRGEWTVTRVRQEVLSTIVSAYNHSKQANLEVEVFLSTGFSLFRVDLHDAYAVVTQEDSKLPALKLVSDSHFYREIEEDLRVSRSLARRLDFGAARDAIRDAATLQVVATALALNLNGVNLDEVLKDALNPPEPYKRIDKWLAK
jgi:hypothetical protein